MDATANDWPKSQFEVSGFPTIFWKPKDNSKPSRYNVSIISYYQTWLLLNSLSAIEIAELTFFILAEFYGSFFIIHMQCDRKNRKIYSCVK